MGIVSNGIARTGGTDVTDATAKAWDIKTGETAYIATGGATGTGYFPAAMLFNGTTGYYSGTHTSSGNKVTVVVAFKCASKAALQVLLHDISGTNARLFVMLRASNDATVERRDKLLVLATNSAGSNVLNIVSSTSYADGAWHTAFIEYDADAGTAQMVVDGASDINTGAAAHLISAATLSSGALTAFVVGAQSAGSNFCDGQIRFCGVRDVGGLTWSDFMQADGTPKQLDETTWAEWSGGSVTSPLGRPLFWHESGLMTENKGSAGAMTANGTITIAAASTWS